MILCKLLQHRPYESQGVFLPHGAAAGDQLVEAIRSQDGSGPLLGTECGPRPRNAGPVPLSEPGKRRDDPGSATIDAGVQGRNQQKHRQPSLGHITGFFVLAPGCQKRPVVGCVEREQPPNGTAIQRL